MGNEPDLEFHEQALEASWSASVTDDYERSNRRAWTVAILASVIALLLAIALIILLPLKTVEPYTILVDRQTGNVEALKPISEQAIAPDTALTRSMLVQYVTARESFTADNLQEDYRRVSLMSAGKVRERYQREIDASSSLSPLSYMSNGAVLKTNIKSISDLGDKRAMVRFTTTRTDPGMDAQAPQHWVAIIGYEFTSAQMSEADRYVNPLGFQVTSYRRDAETLPEEGIVNGTQLPAGNSAP